ncbi:hypothetical protein BJ742DRAFT_813521 [Cladochytrium replicatum]|nr:hypothetical protein BJ742DRAFT_813521 [Cladochytrium replicatum]
MASLLQKINDWIAAIPLATLITATILATSYFVSLVYSLSGDLNSAGCLRPDLLFSNVAQGLYRILTSPMLHANFLHLLLNMLAFLPLGVRAEKANGSLKFACILLILVVLSQVTTVLLSYIVDSVVTTGYLSACIIGFSGVIFGMITSMECMDHRPRPMFGNVLSVPASLYPWVLLVIIQIVLPSASMIGHIGGIAAGYLHGFGLLNIIIPSSSTIVKLEGKPWMSRVTSNGHFVHCPVSLPLRIGDAASPTSPGGGSVFDRLRSLMGSAPASAPSLPDDPRFPGTGRTLDASGLGGVRRTYEPVPSTEEDLPAESSPTKHGQI